LDSAFTVPGTVGRAEFIFRKAKDLVRSFCRISHYSEHCNVYMKKGNREEKQTLIKLGRELKFLIEILSLLFHGFFLLFMS